MDTDALIEWVLERSVNFASEGEAPPLLVRAIQHAVLPGGARVRPRLCVAVAAACGEPECLPIAAAAGAAIELMHCASLVHDDLPAFDAAALRRGNPSVHAAFGEPIAILAGDALIVMAFETLLREVASAPVTCMRISRVLAETTGSPRGIVAGQAWESEATINLSAYHQAKTAALFVAATMSGAASAGMDPARWRALGIRLGEAYQIADDLRDVLLGEEALGKPAGQDAAHSRPSAVEAFGLEGAFKIFSQAVEAAAAAVPDCNGAPFLKQIVAAQAARLVPKSLMQRVA